MRLRTQAIYCWSLVLINYLADVFVALCSDEDYTEKSGIDCVHYLSFQRHLLLLASIMTVLTLGIILPINLHKSIQTDDPIGFSDTTITNLENG